MNCSAMTDTNLRNDDLVTVPLYDYCEDISTKENVLSFSFDHIYAITPDNVNFLQPQQRDIDECTAGLDRLCNQQSQTQKEIDSLKKQLKNTRLELKKLKKLTSVHLDLIQRQSFIVTSKEKHIRALSLENEVLRSINVRQRQNPPPLVSIPSKPPANSNASSKSLLIQDGVQRPIKQRKPNQETSQPGTSGYVPVKKPTHTASKSDTFKSDLISKEADISGQGSNLELFPQNVEDIPIYDPTTNLSSTSVLDGIDCVFDKTDFDIYTTEAQHVTEVTSTYENIDLKNIKIKEEILDSSDIFSDDTVILPKVEKSCRDFSYGESLSNISSGVLSTLSDTKPSTSQKPLPWWQQTADMVSSEFVGDSNSQFASPVQKKRFEDFPQSDDSSYRSSRYSMFDLRKELRDEVNEMKSPVQKEQFVDFDQSDESSYRSSRYSMFDLRKGLRDEVNEIKSPVQKEQFVDFDQSDDSSYRSSRYSMFDLRKGLRDEVNEIKSPVQKEQFADFPQSDDSSYRSSRYSMFDLRKGLRDEVNEIKSPVQMEQFVDFTQSDDSSYRSFCYGLLDLRKGFKEKSPVQKEQFVDFPQFDDSSYRSFCYGLFDLRKGFKEKSPVQMEQFVDFTQSDDSSYRSFCYGLLDLRKGFKEKETVVRKKLLPKGKGKGKGKRSTPIETPGSGNSETTNALIRNMFIAPDPEMPEKVSTSYVEEPKVKNRFFRSKLSRDIPCTITRIEDDPGAVYTFDAQDDQKDNKKDIYKHEIDVFDFCISQQDAEPSLSEMPPEPKRKKHIYDPPTKGDMTKDFKRAASPSASVYSFEDSQETKMLDKARAISPDFKISKHYKSSRAFGVFGPSSDMSSSSIAFDNKKSRRKSTTAANSGRVSAKTANARSRANSLYSSTNLAYQRNTFVGASKRGRQRAMSTGSHTSAGSRSKSSCDINLNKMSIDMELKNGNYTMMSQPEYDFINVGHQPVPETTPINTLEVPKWRIKTLKPTKASKSEIPEEKLDDIVFAKRHAKMELEEKRIKRWDYQRLKEQLHLKKLKERQEKLNPSGKRLLYKSFKQRRVIPQSLWPNPEDVLAIEVVDEIPVCSFGELVPYYKPSTFSLPWLKKGRPRVNSEKKNLPEN